MSVTKGNHKVTLNKNQKGQISIFFSASLVVLITIIAFVINVGLFVKAKINLQNATDSAAFAGASVQARQMTKIAYLNWEMRNVFKEWMYKYYVVGNLNLTDVENPPNGIMKFNLQEDRNIITGGPPTIDKFNIPAVCIHITGSRTNICKRYSIPGLPEFGSSSLVGAEEASRAFQDILTSTKVNDCIDRTRLNMTVALTWAYNVLGNSIDDAMIGRGPAILSDRQGAWPRAVELALRIRNLEYVMNRPSEDKKICINGSTNLTNCSASIQEIEGENRLGNERIVKAFYSAYRNLGNEDDNEMKATFTLTELPPQKNKFENETSPSNLLIPSSKIYEKQWIDLKLMMVNYAVFYAAMIPRANDRVSGACDISKVAIPVPGYPLGFYKNPDILTYYAVKGEAEFIGMFNPFAEGAVKLQAYAAAKPMGGRIGPMLFTESPSGTYLTGRTDNKLRSIPYITSFKFEGTTIRGQTYDETNGEKFIPGLPLPTNSRNPPGSFWLEDPSKPVGGKLTNASEIQFGLPNLVYEYQVRNQKTGYTLNNQPIYVVDSSQFETQPGQNVGLFSGFQFKKFKGENLSGNITPQTLDAELARVRAPTQYEAANYLIPTPNNIVNESLGLDSFGFIGGAEVTKGSVKVFESTVYAPLYRTNDQQDLLFSNTSDLTSTIFEFMRAQEAGMKKYRLSMNRAAMNIFNTNNFAAAAQGTKSGYESAARGISDLPDFNTVEGMPQSCSSLAGQFLNFFFGGLPGVSEVPTDNQGCPTPLSRLLEEYYSSATRDPSYDPNYYAFNYSYDPSKNPLDLMTGYMPGPFTGSNLDGSFTNPLLNVSNVMRRNFYSTKFVTLDSVQSGSSETFDNDGFAVHSEGDATPSAGPSLNTYHKQFKNALQTNDDLSSIKY